LWVGLFIDRSRKLKLLTPKPLAAAKEAYDGGASALKPPQRPMKDGGCIAASGEEASIMVLDLNVGNDPKLQKETGGIREGLSFHKDVGRQVRWEMPKASPLNGRVEWQVRVVGRRLEEEGDKSSNSHGPLGQISLVP
jgi:hypothetical protein